MASYNRVILMGRLTRNIELKFTPAGLAIAEVGMAINNRRKNRDGEWVDEPCFVDVTMFGRTAEVASEYLTKGSPLFVEGHLKFDSWERDGQKRSKLSVVCDRLQLLGDKSGPSGSSEGGHAKNVDADGEGSASRSTAASNTGSSNTGSSKTGAGKRAAAVKEAPVQTGDYAVGGRGEAQPTGEGDGYNDPDIPF